MSGLAIVFFFIAFLYGMVGLGGGSAYVAVLALTSTPQLAIAPTALFLDIFVTLIGFGFYRKHLDLRYYAFFLLGLYSASFSGAWFGAHIALPKQTFYLLLGSVLIGASILSWIKSLIKFNESPPFSLRKKVILVGLSFCIGMLAGIVGIGGGIFLAPILLLAGFPPKGIAGITSLYILINATSGVFAHALQGHIQLLNTLPYVISVSVGAFLGAFLGSRKLHPNTIRHVLNALIFLVGARIMWTHLFR